MTLHDSTQCSFWPMLAEREVRKDSGAYYTPDSVVRSLVSWAVRKRSDRLLDPACGDGRFLAAHANSVGVELDAVASAIVRTRVPGRLIHQGDFFSWAAKTHERFDCAAGNPPFIRYQRFSGAVRDAAVRLCRRHGVMFSSLSSSWAPFLAATATLLKPGGRMAFVVPAEIGHAPYSAPLLGFLSRCFGYVQVVAIREKLFPQLSTDCWLLYADGYGDKSASVRLTALERFAFLPAPPSSGIDVALREWEKWNFRLRPFFLSDEARECYTRAGMARGAQRLGEVARVGIGYVSGANDFFHLRPSQSRRLSIPQNLLHPAVRNGRSLTSGCVDHRRVERWIADDDAVLLLRLDRGKNLPAPVRRYLDSEAAREARQSYKCRSRDPWYVVPDVTVPDGFLSYMSGAGPTLAENAAGCVCTNSVHAVHLNKGMTMPRLKRLWSSPLTTLSCEIEGHPLGGGLLKLEPREAARVLLKDTTEFKIAHEDVFMSALATMRRWRHYEK